MSDVFATLCLQPSLAISSDALNAAYRDAGKRLHPDAGGDPAEFAKLQDAFATISSPARRLKAWLACRGIEIDPRGTIDPELVELFATIGTVVQQAEAVIRERDQARSALSRAMLEEKAQRCRENVEASIAHVQQTISSACEVFPQWESAADIDQDQTARLVRDLGFLEKWLANLRSCYARLV